MYKTPLKYRHSTNTKVEGEYIIILTNNTTKERMYVREYKIAKGQYTLTDNIDQAKLFKIRRANEVYDVVMWDMEYFNRPFTVEIVMVDFKRVKKKL